MGILKRLAHWFNDSAHRSANRCVGCGSPLRGMQSGVCSEECEWAAAIR